MASFAAYMMLGPKGAVTERYLGEVTAENAARALMKAKSTFAYGQPFSRTRIVVRSEIVDVQPGRDWPVLTDPCVRAGLYLAIGLVAAFALGSL